MAHDKLADLTELCVIKRATHIGKIAPKKNATTISV